jgi:hypothetical protein
MAKKIIRMAMSKEKKVVISTRNRYRASTCPATVEA